MPFFMHPILLLLVVPAWFVWRRFANARGIGGVIRFALLVILVVIVAEPVIDAPESGSTVVLVVDRSRSMPATAKQLENSLRQQAPAEQRESEQFAVVGFGARAVVEQSPGRPPLTNVPDVGRDESNLHAAVAAALELVPTGGRGRLLLLSDGLADDSLAEPLAAQLRQRGVRVDFLQPPQHRPHETRDVELRSVRAPTRVAAGEDITFELELVASDPSPRTLQADRDGALVSVKQVELNEGLNHLVWTDRSDHAGVFEYSFQIAAAGDASPGNNTWATWVEVRGDPAVLVLDAAGGDTPIVELLRRADLAVDVIAADKADLAIEKLSAYHACVLENVPAPSSGSARAKVLVDFVEQLGGGLMVTGGDRSFGAGGYRFSPIEPLLPVSLRTLGASERPAHALVVLADPHAWDSSGLESEPKVTPLQHALLSLAQELDPTDRMGIVTPRTPDPVVFPLSNVTRSNELRDTVQQLGLSNDPSAFPLALSAAWEMLRRAQQPGKHLVLMVTADQLATWPPPAFNPFALKPIDGATISILTWGQPSTRTQVAATGQAAGWAASRFLATNDSAQLAPILKADWELATGGSFVSRPTAIAISPTLPADDASRIATPLPTLAGFHAASVRNRARATLVAKDAAGQPLVARWARGPGRVSAALFPFAPTPQATPEWDHLGAALLEQIRWVGRIREATNSAVPIAIERVDRAVTVRLPANDVDSLRTNATAPLELRVVQPAGGPLNSAVLFRRDGSEYVAHFALNQTGTYFAVVQQDGELIARTPPITLPRSTEFLRPESAADGLVVLNRLAQASDGAEHSRGAPVFDESAGGHRSLVPIAAILAAVLLAFDVTDRRFQFTGNFDRRLHQIAARRRQRRAAEERLPEPTSDPFDQAKEKLRQRLKR
jgi:uncharacterized membrane protein